MDNLFEKANKYYETNPKEALILYSQAIEEYPEDIRGYVGLARCFCSLNQLDEAIEKAEEALERNAYSVEAYHVLTAVSIIRKEKKKSFLYAEKAYSIDPHSYPSLANLGIVKDDAGNYKKSAELFEKALKLQPENSSLRYKLIINYLQLRKWDEAKLELRTLQKTVSSIASIESIAILRLRIASSLKIKYYTFMSIIKTIIFLGRTCIIFGALLFQNLFLIIVSELLLLYLIILTIKFKNTGKIAYIILFSLTMLLILAVAISD